jgi:hypothetical protein
MSRFPPPAVTLLKISGGDTLTVKSRLNAGESRAAFARMMVEGSDGTLRVDRQAQAMALMLAYLVDWSLTDEAGHLVVIREQPIAVVEAAVEALDVDSYLEIKDAIEMHDVAVLQARTEEKKARTGASASPPTSPLPDAATGATNGSPS